MNERLRPAPQPYCNEQRPPIVLNEIAEERSGQVRAIGYDEATRTLAVQFRRGEGAIYHYPNVPPDLHRDFINAESLGIFHSKFIKDMVFKKYRPEQQPA
jgi:hypothetical protein